ncbi:chemotaxis-specific protein-glutamate methyltransferase CheB [Tsuneonella sp. HG222]
MTLASTIGMPGANRPSQRGRPIRVLVVDDSLIVRAAFSRLVEREADLALAGSAATAEDALRTLSGEHVDVILLDLEMPGIGGLGALPRMIERAREAKILVVSSFTADGAEATVEALALGAADTLQKPSGGFDQVYREKLLAKVRALGGRSPLRQGMAQGSEPGAALRSASRRRAEVVALGSSTGGIHALGQFFGALPSRPGVPILVTQHLPASFIQAFSHQLHEVSGMPTLKAEDGMRLQPDHIFVAPGDAHMLVERRAGESVIALDRRPSPSGCMPSVDPMFASLARTYGPAALGVVLTGMGRDGTQGARDLADAGGTLLVQDEVSSAVWGMPGSVAKAGLASAILHPVDLAARVGAAARAGSA